MTERELILRFESGKPEWETRDRETYSATELRKEYRDELYSEKGRQIVADEQ